MDAKRITTSSGKLLYKPIMAEHEMYECSDDGTGFCVRCGEYTSGVEPDAAKYTCESCGQSSVYGIEILALRGFIEVIDEDEKEPEEAASK